MVLEPMFQISIYFLIYTVIRAGKSNDHLPVLIGDVFLFSLTTDAMRNAGVSIPRARTLMLNSAFPRALLPMSSVYQSLYGFVPRAAIFAVIFVVVGGHLSVAAFLLPLLFAIQFVMNVGVALVVSTFVALVEDGQNVISYLARILMICTPVIYPVNGMLPSARALVSWQPLFALFAAYQAVFGGHVPDPVLVLQASVWAAALLFLGSRTFLKHESEFASRL
jgi:teichoic acid transport system permease protein